MEQDFIKGRLCLTNVIPCDKIGDFLDKGNAVPLCRLKQSFSSCNMKKAEKNCKGHKASTKGKNSAPERGERRGKRSSGSTARGPVLPRSVVVTGCRSQKGTQAASRWHKAVCQPRGPQTR